MLRKVPLIVILGSTGTGKTKLSIELAERFAGEIISADSMQVYANLNIVTAKATKSERQRVKHHMLDVATTHQPFTVFQYRNEALPIIENLLVNEKRSPIIVGGTNYYIESLLWDVLINTSTSIVTTTAAAAAATAIASAAAASALTSTATTTPEVKTQDILIANNLSMNMKKENDSSNLIDGASALATVPTLPTASATSTSASAVTISTLGIQNAGDKRTAIISSLDMSTMPSELLHNHLRQIDPEAANRIHPNNKRKIIRGIEYYQETGVTLSSKINEQRQQPGGNRLGGPLRYPHTIILWLKCNQDVLNNRLEKRIDGMLEEGLLSEIRAFYNEHKPETGDDKIEYTKGILQSIGFKEFIPYLEQFNIDNDQEIETYLKRNAYIMPTQEQFKSNEKSTGFNLYPAGLDVLNQCLNELKLVTIRYSKKQLKWINNRYLCSTDRQVPVLYDLNTTNIDKWNEEVYAKAVAIINAYCNNELCEIEPLRKKIHPCAGLNEETTNICSICQRTFIGEYQWKLHLKSNKHKRRKESEKRKKAKLQNLLNNNR